MLGVVYHAVVGEPYLSIRGGGAWLGNRRLSAASPTARTRTVSVKSGHGTKPAFAMVVDRLRAAGYETERMESTALKLCWVATGRRAGIVKWLARPGGVLANWGTAAGVLMCEEVGVYPLRFDGARWAGAEGGLVVGDRQFEGDSGVRSPEAGF